MKESLIHKNKNIKGMFKNFFLFEENIKSIKEQPL